MLLNREIVICPRAERLHAIPHCRGIEFGVANGLELTNS